MLEAKLFKDGEEVIVQAVEVKDGKYSKRDNFVDIDDEFRVIPICGNKRIAHFRRYLSLDDYRRLSPEQRQKYDIIRPLRHWQDGPWHRGWQSKLKSFCEIEKHIKDLDSRKYRRADAFYKEKNLCIELQHSFIDRDFERRNEFYAKQGIKTIWLYDLTEFELRKINDDNGFEIVENNSKGIFRIAKKDENLKNNLVFIQAKDQKIYQIDELLRKQINNNEGLESTIRYFYPVAIYTENEFISAIKNGNLLDSLNEEEIGTLFGLWRKANPTRYAIFQNVDTGYYIGINRNPCEQKTIRGYVSSTIDGLFGKPLSDIYYSNDACFKLIYKK